MPEAHFPADQRRSVREMDRRIRAAAQLLGRKIAMHAAPDAFAVPVTSTWAATHVGLAFRQGVTITATLLVTVPASTQLQVRLALDAPASETGPLVTVETGTDQVVDVTVNVPEDWAYNARALLRVEAQRSSGSGTNLVRLLQVVQR
jgi:hypothetical protein